MSVSIRAIAAVMMCVGAAAGANAQCDVYRWNVPDFDQKRNGLPGDGGMYCVPTSAVNWMAYIANNGYAPMMSGPRVWQSQANAGLVTSTDAFMGTLMGTTASGGTGGNSGLDGLRLYLMSRAPFLFTATVWYGGITPLDMWLQMQTNGLVNICYGYYEQQPGINGSYYTRNGGHCVTLNGVVDMCTAGTTPTLRLRNPADDSDLFSQSTFSTVTTHGNVETFRTSVLPGITKTLTRMADFGVGSTTRRYVDTMYVIRSNIACWSPATNAPEIHLSSLVHLFGDATQQDFSVQMPAGSSVNAIALHPDQAHAVYVRRTPVAVGTGLRLHLLNLGDRSDTDLGPVSPAGAGKTPIAFDRFGRLITCDGSVLKIMDLSGPAPTVLFSRTLAAGASSICFDDTNDEVVVLTPANGRLIRCSPDLATVIDEPLPSGVPAMGDGSVVPDPVNQRYLLTIPGDGSVRELSLITGGPRLQLSSSLLLPAVQSIQDIQPADGGGFFAMCDGSVRVLDRDPASGRLRVSPTQIGGGLPAMRTMSIGRSRTNYDASLHSGPAWVNIPNPSEGARSVPDCMGDYNLDGRLTVQDVFDFIAGWFANDPHADVNGSASLTVQDVFDFIGAWFAGCP